MGNLSDDDGDANRLFPGSLVPLFQSESKCETILMEITFRISLNRADNPIRSRLVISPLRLSTCFTLSNLCKWTRPAVKQQTETIGHFSFFDLWPKREARGP